MTRLARVVHAGFSDHVTHVELNPVRARLVLRAEGYPWSSARAHAERESDALLAPERPFPGDVGDWSAWLAAGLDEEATERIRRNTMTGRPTGSPSFVAQLESLLGRTLSPLKRGRKPKGEEGSKMGQQGIG